MKIATEHVLNAARLPIHFWNEMRHVDDFDLNIGRWLHSWVIAHSIYLEYSELPEELRRPFLECEAFSKEIDEITSWLTRQVKALLGSVEESNPIHKKLSVLAYNFLAAVDANKDIGSKRELLITTKIELDGLKHELLNTPPPKVYA